MSDWDLHENRLETLRKRALERLRNRSSYHCPDCRLSRLPRWNCPRCGCRVRVQGAATRMSFERTCTRCGRDTRMAEPLCDRCRRTARAEKRGGQLRLW